MRNIYQVCYNFDLGDGVHGSRVCYETDSEYDAQCYIREMYHLGDYSNYYIKKSKRRD